MSEFSDTETQISTKQSHSSGYIKYLSPSDLEGYNQLKDRFHKEVANAKRGEKVEMFNKRLKIIKEYVVRNDDDDWKRSFAAGVIFLDNYIAINIKQLILLMGKCKSSINGSLHQLGYIARPASKETDENLINSFPIFSKDRRELKKWTIRQKKSSRRKQLKQLQEHKIEEKIMENEEPLVDEPKQEEIPRRVALPSITTLVPEPMFTKTSEDVMNVVTHRFPVPAKFRYKMLSAFYFPMLVTTA